MQQEEPCSLQASSGPREARPLQQGSMATHAEAERVWLLQATPDRVTMAPVPPTQAHRDWPVLRRAEESVEPSTASAVELEEAVETRWGSQAGPARMARLQQARQARQREAGAEAHRRQRGQLQAPKDHQAAAEEAWPSVLQAEVEAVHLRCWSAQGQQEQQPQSLQRAPQWLQQQRAQAAVQSPVGRTCEEGEARSSQQ